MIASCAARVRLVARQADRPNPVPHLLSFLLEYLSGTVGPEKAARLLESVEFDPPDKAVVRELLFGVREDTQNGLAPPGGTPTSPQSNDEVDSAITERVRAVNYGDVIAAEGVTTVALNDDGHLVRYHPDGTPTQID